MTSPKPRLTTWGNPRQFIAHRGDERMLFDHAAFSDEAACWAAVEAWLTGGPAGFDITRRYELVRIGLFAVYQAKWTGTEVLRG